MGGGITPNSDGFLDLCNVGITKVPKKLPDGTASLSLEQNDLSKDENGVAKLLTHKLRGLCIRDCKLEQISFNPDKCTIQDLDVSLNNLDLDTIQQIQQVEALTTLDVGCCGLRQMLVFVPETRLQKLYVYGNPISDGLVQTFQIPTLQVLDVHSCDFRAIPPVDPSKCNLRELYLADNRLSEESLSIVFNFRQLQILSLKNCKLKELPPINADVSRLTTLYISHNKLSDSSLQRVLEMPCLQRLYANDCGIKVIPVFDRTKCQITTLDLNRNSFALPGCIDQVFAIPHLESLDVHDSGLKALPECILICIQLKQLVFVSRHCDNIQKLKSALDANSLTLLSRLPCLTRLDNYSQVALDAMRISHQIFRLNSQRQLVLTNKGLTKVPEAIPTDTLELLLSENNFSLDQEAVAGLFTKQYRALFLGWCGLTQVVFNPQICNLVELDVGNPLVGLQQVEGGNAFDAESIRCMTHIPTLLKLSLKNCGLVSVPEFPPYSKLTDLNLSWNCFSDYRGLSAVFEMQSLTTLNIWRCGVTQLPQFNPLLSKIVNLNVVDAYPGNLSPAKNQLDEPSLSLIARMPKLRTLDELTEADLAYLRADYKGRHTKRLVVRKAKQGDQNIISEQMTKAKVDAKQTTDAQLDKKLENEDDNEALVSSDDEASKPAGTKRERTEGVAECPECGMIFNMKRVEYHLHMLQHHDGKLE